MRRNSVWVVWQGGRFWSLFSCSHNPPTQTPLEGGRAPCRRNTVWSLTAKERQRGVEKGIVIGALKFYLKCCIYCTATMPFTMINAVLVKSLDVLSIFFFLTYYHKCSIRCGLEDKTIKVLDNTLNYAASKKSLNLVIYRDLDCCQQHIHYFNWLHHHWLSSCVKKEE